MLGSCTKRSLCILAYYTICLWKATQISIDEDVVPNLLKKLIYHKIEFLLILYKKKQSTTMGASLWDKEKTKQTNLERQQPS